MKEGVSALEGKKGEVKLEMQLLDNVDIKKRAHDQKRKHGLETSTCYSPKKRESQPRNLLPTATTITEDLVNLNFARKYGLTKAR